MSLRAGILSRIEKDYKKKLVHSDATLGDFFDHEDLDEKEFDGIVEELLLTGQIYKFGDMESYLENVRKRECMSIAEQHMVQGLKGRRTHRCVLRDLEFPIDATGRYDFIDINTKPFYMVEGKKFYKSEPL